MAAAASTKVGLGACPSRNCGKPVHFKRSSGGKLGYACGYCDTSGFAQPNGDGEKEWLSTIDKPAEAAPPTPDKTPAAKSSGFNLKDL